MTEQAEKVYPVTGDGGPKGRVRIKKDWGDAGRMGTQMGHRVDMSNGQQWVPVMWDDEEDPDWHKAMGLDFLQPGQEGNEAKYAVEKRCREAAKMVFGVASMLTSEDSEAYDAMKRALQLDVVTIESLAETFLKGLLLAVKADKEAHE